MMKIFQLSPAYDKKQIINLDKLPSYFLRTYDGKVIFITHGSKNGHIVNKELGDKMGYDEIIHCYLNGVIIWVTFRFFEKDGEKRTFLITYENGERILVHDQKFIYSECCKIWTE